MGKKREERLARAKAFPIYKKRTRPGDVHAWSMDTSTPEPWTRCTHARRRAPETRTQARRPEQSGARRRAPEGPERRRAPESFEEVPTASTAKDQRRKKTGKQKDGHIIVIRVSPKRKNMENWQALGDVQHVKAGKRAKKAASTTNRAQERQRKSKETGRTLHGAGAGPMGKDGPSKVETV